jgi:3-oxoacyl-(acyl-carrier-protein) synthase
MKALNGSPVFPLAAALDVRVAQLRQEQSYTQLDRTALLGILCARETINIAGERDIGCITVGSSRGATSTLEETIQLFASGEARVPPLTSPITTAGNLSSWIAQDRLTHGTHTATITMSTSMTCSSAFHSLLVARSFLVSGMASTALFGGSEACLTPYSLAQLEALRIYSHSEGAWPCTPFSSSPEESNSVALGEGAGTALLLHDDGRRVSGDLALLGVGWALESIPSATGISTDGLAFEQAMRMASSELGPKNVGMVISHAPGSRRGDAAELAAIRKVFPHATICSTKHLTGHTYGASGMISLDLARFVLDGGVWSGLPYPSVLSGGDSNMRAGSAIAINTAGFGGNAVSLIIGTP